MIESIGTFPRNRSFEATMPDLSEKAPHGLSSLSSPNQQNDIGVSSPNQQNDIGVSSPDQQSDVADASLSPQSDAADAAPAAVESSTPQHAGVAGQPLYNIRAFYTCTSCALVYSRQVPNCSVCTAPVAPIQGSSHEGNSVCTICRTPLTRRGGKVCGDTCRKRAEKLYRDDPVRYAHLAPRPHRNATRLRTTHSFRKYLRELSTQYDVPLVLPSGAVKPTLYELMPFIAGLDVAYGLTGPRAFLGTGLPISEYMNWREEQNLIVPAYLTNILTEFDE